MRYGVGVGVELGEAGNFKVIDTYCKFEPETGRKQEPCAKSPWNKISIGNALARDNSRFTGREGREGRRSKDTADGRINRKCPRVGVRAATLEPLMKASSALPVDAATGEETSLITSP
jgi:hypothetical protein